MWIGSAADYPYRVGVPAKVRIWIPHTLSYVTLFVAADSFNCFVVILSIDILGKGNPRMTLRGLRLIIIIDSPPPPSDYTTFYIEIYLKISRKIKKAVGKSRAIQLLGIIKHKFYYNGCKTSELNLPFSGWIK